MFIIHIAVDSRWSPGKDPAKVLGDAIGDVMAPVTLTSLTNFFMFMVMARSDLPGIYETAYVAMMAIVMLWFIMVTAFPAVVAIDLARQSARRSELCCICSTVDKDADNKADCSATAFISEQVEAKLYLPAITSVYAQVVIGFFSVAAIVICAIKMGDLPLGLEMNE